LPDDSKAHFGHEELATMEDGIMSDIPCAPMGLAALG
jgi:hypothetical protein